MFAGVIICVILLVVITGLWHLATDNDFSWLGTSFGVIGLVIVVGAILAAIVVVAYYGNVVDTEKQVVKSDKRLAWRPTVTDKHGTTALSPEAQGVIDETDYHEH